MKRVTVLSPAEAEYRQALKWYSDRDPRVAARFADEVRNTLRLIETFPQIGGHVPEVYDAHVRRMPIHSFPYHAIFHDGGAELQVVAFAHHRRRPRYFIRRLRRRDS